MAGTSVIAALGWALLDFVWQGLIVGALAALALLALRNARPQARYAVACLALALCLVLPLAGLWRGLDTGSSAQVEPIGHIGAVAAVAQRFSVDALPSPDSDWRATLQTQMPAIVAAWSAGALLLALRLLLGCHWVGRLRAGARLPNSWWQGRFDELAVHVGLRAPVPIRLSDAIDTPVAAGWWRPVVLVPAALLSAMPVEYIEALLAHELAHVRRRDYLVNLLQGAVETLLFYHPVVWWLSRRARIEREQIADDLALRAIDDPRRLALALQALDQFQEDRARRGASLPHAPQLLPAAHGGQLMSRIKRLLRPDHQRPDWKLALPVAGLAALGLAMHAAQAMAPAVAPVAPVAAVPHVAATPAVAPVAAPAPVAATPAVAPAPAVAPVAAAAPVAGTPVTRMHNGDKREPYAMVKEGEDGMTLSGDLDDMQEVKIAKQHLRGDFLWFRRGGVGYVVQDPALLERARRAWAPADAISKQMDALSAQMKPHSEKMEALGKQMEQYSTNAEPYRKQMEELSARMEPLARQQSELGEKMQKVSMKQVAAKQSQEAMAQHQAEMQQLQVQMESLSGKMEVLSREMEQKSALMQKAHAPMEELGRQMQEAGKPMEALGKQMEPLGKKMEAISHQADAEVSRVIDEAMHNGKAVPAKQLSR